MCVQRVNSTGLLITPALAERYHVVYEGLYKVVQTVFQALGSTSVSATGSKAGGG